MTLIIWAVNRFRPREGWPLFLLVIGVLIPLPLSIVDGGWVPEVEIVWRSVTIIFAISYLLFRLGRGSRLSWVVIALYLFAIPPLYMLSLSPLRLFLDGYAAYQAELEQSWLLLATRLSVWLQAVLAGESSRETLAFAILLALLSGIVTALFVWSIYQHKRPLIGFALLLLAHGFNAYYSTQQIEYIFTTLILGLVTLGFWQQRNREEAWDQVETDYSDEMWISNGLVTFFLGFVILFGAIGLPSIPYSSISRAFRNSAPIVALNNQLERSFGGVQASEPALASSGSGDGSGNGTAISSPGVFPRAYLLGNLPELAETPIFEASVSALPAGSSHSHWRMTHYDEYTGRGWRQSAGDILQLNAGDQIEPAVESASLQMLTQEVNWLGANGVSTFATIGEPINVDRGAELYYREREQEVISLQASEFVPINRYVAQSSLFTVDPIALNEISPQAFEESPLYGRYTTLPDNISERTVALAQQITADVEGPYAQAKALETYLRQYSYNLVIELPEAREPVDYFLFELQEGYCDLYATAMVVMARSIGLPARLGVGYIVPGDQSGNGMTVRQDHGHSWAEIYFPNHGWVEFEPTAGFVQSLSGEDPLQEQGDEAAPLPAVLPPPPIELGPEDQASPIYLLTILAASVLMTLCGFALYRYYWRTQPKSFFETYQTLIQLASRLGYNHLRSETPSEFRAGFQQYLRAQPTPARLQEEKKALQAEISSFVTIFEADRFGSFPQALSEQAWQSLQSRFFRLWIAYRLRGWLPQRGPEQPQDGG